MWVWGVWLLLFPHTFEISPSYAYMSYYAEEGTWGALLFLCGFIYILTFYHPNKWYRRIAGFPVLMLWCTIAGTIIIGATTSTGIVVYSLLAVFTMLDIVYEEV